MPADHPELVRAIRLLQHVEFRGFRFHSDPTEGGGPLVGTRVSAEWMDTIHLEGFSRDCVAWRQRPGGGPIEHRVQGSALRVLTEVVSWGVSMLHTEAEAGHALRG